MFPTYQLYRRSSPETVSKQASQKKKSDQHKKINRAKSRQCKKLGKSKEACDGLFPIGCTWIVGMRRVGAYLRLTFDDEAMTHAR